MDHALRPSGHADAEPCAAVFERAWNAGHPGTLRAIDAADFLRRTEGESVIVAVRSDGGILGFASVHEPGAFVHYLMVDPDHARQGIGRALLAAAVALAGGRATLKCQIANEDARRFYRREGWTEAESGTTDGIPWIRMLSPR